MIRTEVHFIPTQIAGPEGSHIFTTAEKKRIQTPCIHRSYSLTIEDDVPGMPNLDLAFDSARLSKKTVLETHAMFMSLMRPRTTYRPETVYRYPIN